MNTAPTIRDGHVVSTHPATGKTVSRFAVSTSQDVTSAVATARQTQRWWADLGFAARRKILLDARAVMAQRIRKLMVLIRAETGKSVSDAFTEISTSFEHLAWAPKNARRVLGPRRVRGPLSLIDHTNYLEYRPYGVVAVIGPWNYPMHTPMGSIVYALAAGNTVVFKPSEYTPGVGQWLADVLCEVAGRPIVRAVHGDGEVGATLCQDDVDKIAFTGSENTARKVAVVAAQRLVPTLLEAGGKDAVIVDGDADVASAANFVAWGAFSNAGQSCVGYERVYVVDSLADDFIAAVTDIAAGLVVGHGEDAQIGPITMPSQVEVIAAHIDDALTRGAHAALGGREAVEAPFVRPTILLDAPEDSIAMRNETFGPVLMINRVPDAAEALRRANDTPYGLGGAVFGKRQALALARRMRSGMTAINSGFAFAGTPALPFGGLGASGYGRAHGDDGLREFARTKAITKRRMRPLIPLMSLRRKNIHNRMIERFVTFGTRGKSP